MNASSMWIILKEKRISIFWFIIIIAFLSIGVFSFINHLPAKPPLTVYKIDTSNNTLSYISQQSGILTKPLLLVDGNNESGEFAALKQSISHYIEQQRQAGKISDGSVYFRKLSNNDWFVINPNVQYSPGSIAKIFLMLSWLKEIEKNPELIKKTISFTAHVKGLPQRTETGPPLQLGKSYTIKDLLYYLIVYSDNDASNLLMQNIPFDKMKKVFTDMGLPEPHQGQMEYHLNVDQCSRLLRLLYNSTYLYQEMSEYALSLLSQATYNEGLTKGIDKSITVAHKFGEHSFGNWKELHETAIFYYSGNPYLLTVMTKGADYNALHFILNDISNMVFTEMKNRNS